MTTLAPAAPGHDTAIPDTPAALPRSSTVVRAFSHPAEVTALHPVLVAAAKLAGEHGMRAEAHRLVHDPHADDHVLACATRTIAARDTGCAVLAEQIDIWAATVLAEPRTAMLHTETLGRLINRLCGVWTRWRLLSDDEPADPGITLALHQLTELCRAYDDLITDLQSGRRSLPVYQAITTPDAVA
ncbi:DUF4254 domain-containing protein [Lentzea sp. BCCO 10_0798]|uniref:DUF4254 domain-containing protein n=1 Tax=Lentzea kristufekii TaxID=3095430 RepID=A0ABU4TZR6_9PSEU|nr:DUF4254 domain-containing protein [Lentzea sp. BCCO 10_0798]MDX8053812.1 DUF4254 domain-containing protein [Lentzea sp. BCCO 10_0798]